MGRIPAFPFTMCLRTRRHTQKGGTLHPSSPPPPPPPEKSLPLPCKKKWTTTLKKKWTTALKLINITCFLYRSLKWGGRGECKSHVRCTLGSADLTWNMNWEVTLGVQVLYNMIPAIRQSKVMVSKCFNWCTPMMQLTASAFKSYCIILVHPHSNTWS